MGPSDGNGNILLTLSQKSGPTKTVDLQEGRDFVLRSATLAPSVEGEVGRVSYEVDHFASEVSYLVTLHLAGQRPRGLVVSASALIHSHGCKWSECLV